MSAAMKEGWGWVWGSEWRLPLPLPVPLAPASLFVPVFVIVLVGFAAFAIRERVKPKPKPSTLPIPTVRGGLPVFGHALEMLKIAPYDQLNIWVKEYGNIYRFYVFGKECFCVADPKLLKETLHTQLHAFKKDVEFAYKPFQNLLGHGLVTSEGKAWRDQRTNMSKVLRIDILEELPEMTRKALNRLIVKLDACKATGSSIELGEEFRQLTLQVIAEAILSISPEVSDDVFAKLYLAIVEEGHKRVWYPWRYFLPTSEWFAYKRHVAELNTFITTVIHQRRVLRAEEKRNKESHRKEDILDRIMSAIGDDEWTDKAIENVCDQVKTFILAGHETSAAGMTWAMFELIRNKQCLQKLREEARSVLPPPPFSVLPSNESIDKLIYSVCCLKESLRRYSVVPIVARQCTEDVYIGEYFIPKGSRAFIFIQGVHEREDVWEDPMAFKPERFLSEHEPYSFLPFIQGPRNCLGQYLSLLETKIVLSTLVHNYTFTLCDEAKAAIKHPYIIPIMPFHGLHVTVS